ncbi:hypothetical protein EELLY_v1c07700 [Entomoplasma ellychniae]|uniref:Uncharacterized protein n=1 Tax=Entomoplasma ellychniae TaxID=2114 RepID=A0A8E2QWP9_9MOLU|nr:hypothetical protein [Entomoplasma ellychniae]PPE05082.1 hypothetical protein EELLY_v1c07700 [Entomoplasma ellychniae]
MENKIVYRKFDIVKISKIHANEIFRSISQDKKILDFSKKKVY